MYIFSACQHLRGEEKTVNNNKKCIGFPHSNRLKNARKLYRQSGENVAFNYRSIVLETLNDNKPTDDRNRGMYVTLCGNYAEAVYLWETGRKFTTRIQKHKRDMRGHHYRVHCLRT